MATKYNKYTAWTAPSISTDEVGALKWGTGFNPVHKLRGGPGRDVAPDPPDTAPPGELLESTEPTYGYTDEDVVNVLYGYNDQTGTAERAPWDMPTNRSDNPTNYPAWGPYQGGMPGGQAIRAENNGADIANAYKQKPSETVNEGWLNKQVTTVNDAVTSDPSQYEMQTSMTQRDKVRAGSQMPSGRANEYDAPIASRQGPQKLKVYSGGERHYDMTPRAQDDIIRPWWMRTAGTGNTEWMLANEAYVSQSYDRVTPSDPAVGPETPASDAGDYGYVSEDYTYGGF